MNHDVVAETSSREPHTRPDDASTANRMSKECTTSKLFPIGTAAALYNTELGCAFCGRGINLFTTSHNILVYIETAIRRTGLIIAIAQCPVSILDSHSKQHGGNHVEVSTGTYR